MGLLTEGAPSCVDVCGDEVPVNTDWRVWMTVWQVLEDPAFDVSEKAAAVLALAYPDGDPFGTAMRSPNDALEAALRFLRREQVGIPPRPLTRTERRLRNTRLFDWEYDAPRIAADFQIGFFAHIEIPRFQNVRTDYPAHCQKARALFLERGVRN